MRSIARPRRRAARVALAGLAGLAGLVVLVGLAALAVGGSSAPAAAAQPLFDLSTVRVRQGDAPGWAAPALDDAAWPRAQLADVTAAGGPTWLRAEVVLTASTFAADRPVGLLFAGLASHELYWDGARIGRGGVVGDSAAAEVPGPLVARHWLPSHLVTPGRHVIAVRLSAFHRSVPVHQPLWALLLGGYDELGATAASLVWLAIASCSGLVLGAGFAFAMYVARRADRAFLYLSALCLTAVALLGVEAWRPLVGYSYDWHGPRLVIVSALTWLLNLLVVAFAVVRLPRRGHRRFVALAAAGMAAAWLAPGWDTKAWLMFLIGLGLASGWTLRAARAGQRGSRLMAAALGVSLIALLAAPARFADASVFLLLDFLLLCLIVPYTIEREQERARHDRALATAARLETELVRKHLQPHFLMNTLTALNEWIEEDPRVAGEIIDALAEEFRLLHGMLDRSLITLDEELRLCRAHLAIMSRRKLRAYHLVATGVDPEAVIPPAVLHTLVENAVTHGAARSPSVELRLTASPRGDRVRYVFEAPLGAPPPAAGREGAGTRYIRARLHESYGARCSFQAGAIDGVWRTELELPRSAP